MLALLLLSLTACRAVTASYNGLNHGINGPVHLPHANEAPAPKAPPVPGNPCPGGNGYKTITNMWNCNEGGKWVLVP